MNRVDHLIVALAFGLATALVEVLYVVFSWIVLDRFMWTGESMFWMVPLYYVILFLGLGAVALVLSLIPRRRLPLWVTAGVSAAVAIFSLIYLVAEYRLATITVVLLALGVGVQTGRSVRAHQEGFSHGLRPVTLALFVVVGLMAIGQPVVRELAERRALAGLPEARARAPNILLIILDTVRASSLSLYGYDQPTTPRLEKRASRGAVFERAVATSSWSLPTHASMFTGIDAHLLDASWLIPMDEEPATLAEVLSSHGYVTGGFVANLYYATRESGVARGFQHYEDFRTTLDQFELSTALGQRIAEWGYENLPPARRRHDSKPAAMVSRGFLNWIDHRTERPFFAFLNYFDAHRIYRAPRAFSNSFHTGRQYIDRYDTSIAFLDHKVNRLLRELRKRGRLRNTIVVVTADHGQLINDHGLHGHGFGLYDRTLHVPLIIWYPRVMEGGRRIDRAVSMRDLPATILDLAGIENHPLGGTSLVPLLLQGDSADLTPAPPISHAREGINAKPEQPVSRGDMFSIYHGGLHYILNGDSVIELYDVEADPEEARNLAQNPAYQTEMRNLGSRLKSYVDSTLGGL